MVKNGSQHEYQVRDIFKKYGYACIKGNASGGGSKDNVPDITVSNSRFSFGIEVKYRKSDVVYIKKSQIDGLKKFCYTWGASPIVVVKFYASPYYVFNVDSLRLCEKNYRIKRDDIRKSVELNKFISELE